jgi:hypothetical protein
MNHVGTMSLSNLPISTETFILKKVLTMEDVMLHKYPILLPLGIVLAIIAFCSALFFAWADGYDTAKPARAPMGLEEPPQNLAPVRGHYRGLLHI